jgi:2-keto-4-pentenoate hydratase/2-oxohepta-3-ene-1,7-dioic acid hydratase in catechol pathway
MRLASYEVNGTASYGIATDEGIIDLASRLSRYPDLKTLLGADVGAVAGVFARERPDHKLEDVEFLPVVPNPSKIICIGLNYEDHRLEAGLPTTENPAVFLRNPESQTGHLRPILRPRESITLDYEAEVAVVIGKPGRRITQAQALGHVAGVSCYNEGSVREFQRHTQQYGAGKNFPQTGAFGPWLVTSDAIDLTKPLGLACRLNGTTVQQSSTDQLIFTIPRLIEYVSIAMQLNAGDVIVTGTPAGVGSRRKPPVWMKAGDIVEVEVQGVGVLRNTVVDD